MNTPDMTKGIVDLDVHDLCAELTLDLSMFGLSIDFAGLSLEHPIPIIPNPGDVAGKLMQSANAALAPMAPIFDVLDLLLALPPLLDAIKSLNPAKIIEAIEKFLKKLDKLKKYLPQLMVPRLVKALITVLILALIGLRDEIVAIIAAQSRVDLSSQRAFRLGASDLSAALECAQANIDFQMAVIENNAAPLNRLIGFINVFCQIAGLPELGGLDFEPGTSATAAVAPIDKTIADLTKLRDKIKV